MRRKRVPCQQIKSLESMITQELKLLVSIIISDYISQKQYCSLHCCGFFLIDELKCSSEKWLLSVLMIMRTMGRLLLDALMSRELRMMWMRDDISYSSGRYAADTAGWWSTVNKTMIGDFKKFSHRLLLLRQRVHPALPSTVRTLARPKAQNQ